MLFLSTLLFFSVLWLAYIGKKAAVVNWGGWFINWIDGVGRLLCRHLHRMPPTTIPLPKTGPAIVVANHVSGLDSFVLIAASTRPLRFLVAREQYDRPLLHWLFKASGCIPVDRSGKPELALRQALRALQANEILAIFPHGKIQLKTDPPKRLKGGSVRLSAWTKAPIYPVKITGVACQGSEAIAPFIPSHIRLHIADPITSQGDDMAACLQYLTDVIED